jgi:glyoxylase-like metal-dependent hydrolase (beta-lactamase superfamily II)
MTVDKLLLDPIRIYGLRDGFFHLDGGAMFGVVPKVLWQKKYPADKDNRIKLGLSSLLVKTPSALILIDTGIGTLLKRKYYEFYSVEREPDLLDSLKALGFNPGDIDFVVNTHLHFDHCGNNTRRTENDTIVSTFPRARYVIQKGEWEAALCPCLRDKPSYLGRLFEPLDEKGQLQLVQGEAEITKGVSVVPAPGHTAHHQCVKIEAGGETVFFLGDMVPTSAHVGMSYIMSYDLYPMLTLENKQRILSRAADENWIAAFNHDPDLYFGRIKKKNGNFTFQPLG